jgi:hypothetical protein
MPLRCAARCAGGAGAPETLGLPCGARQERARGQADAAVSDFQRAASPALVVCFGGAAAEGMSHFICCRRSSGLLTYALVATRDSPQHCTAAGSTRRAPGDRTHAQSVRAPSQHARA